MLKLRIEGAEKWKILQKMYYVLRKECHVQKGKSWKRLLKNNDQVTIKRIRGKDIFKEYMTNCIYLSKFIKADYFNICKIFDLNFECYKMILPDFSMLESADKNIFEANFLKEMFAC